MSAPLRVAIVGGGIAGAALAAHLRRHGHRIEGFERKVVTGGGAGLLLAPPALVLLRDLGLEDAVRAAGAVVCGLHARQADGSALFQWNAQRWGYPCIGVGIQRSVLHELLIGAATDVAWQRGPGIERVDAEQGWVIDTSGARHGPYDLVVAGDGAASRLRAGHAWLVAREQRYRWTSFSGLMLHPRGGTRLDQFFRGAHHVASWPVGTTRDGGALLCVSVNVPSEATPHFNDPDRGLAELRRLGMLHAELDALRPMSAWIRLSAREVVMHRYVHGRLAFIGDAAHSLSPQLGQGARLALAGAATLAAALERLPVAQALERYDRQQRHLAQRFQYWSRWLTPLFQSQQPAAQWVRHCLMPPFARLALVERGVSRWLCGPQAD